MGLRWPCPPPSRVALGARPREPSAALPPPSLPSPSPSPPRRRALCRRALRRRALPPRHPRRRRADPSPPACVSCFRPAASARPARLPARLPARPLARSPASCRSILPLTSAFCPPSAFLRSARLPSSRGGKGDARYMCCVALQLCLESALIACATALCLLICRLHPYISRLKCETPCKVDLGGYSLLESTALETYWRPSAQLRFTKVKTQNAAGGARVKLYRARHHQGAHRRCLRRR